MSTEPAVLNPAAAPKTAEQARKKPLIPPQYIAPLFISAILLAAHLAVGVLKSPWHLAAAIGTAMVVELILGRLTYGKFPNLASAYVSGISAGILVRTEEIWPYALTAAIAITSKYVLRVKDKHLWNPTNFAICAMLVLMHERFATLGAELGNSHGSVLVIWILGGFIVSRIKKLHICVTYVGSFIFFAWVRTLFTGHTFWAEVAPLTGPMYQLFTFFMITDPKTTVSSRKGQVVVAFLIAAMECVLRLNQNIHAPYFALGTVGPVANLVELWWKGRHGHAKPAPAPAAAASGAA
jgi:hypothetical protein